MSFVFKLIYVLASTAWVIVMIPAGLVAYGGDTSQDPTVLLISWMVMTFGPILAVGAVGAKMGEHLGKNR